MFTASLADQHEHDTLLAAQARMSHRIAELDTRLRGYQVAGLQAPAFVNVPLPPITEAQVDALLAQEHAG